MQKCNRKDKKKHGEIKSYFRILVTLHFYYLCGNCDIDAAAAFGAHSFFLFFLLIDSGSLYLSPSLSLYLSISPSFSFPRSLSLSLSISPYLCPRPPLNFFPFRFLISIFVHFTLSYFSLNYSIMFFYVTFIISYS